MVDVLDRDHCQLVTLTTGVILAPAGYGSVYVENLSTTARTVLIEFLTWPGTDVLPVGVLEQRITIDPGTIASLTYPLSTTTGFVAGTLIEARITTNSESLSGLIVTFFTTNSSTAPTSIQTSVLNKDFTAFTTFIGS
ncbi:MAG: hypothetical protein H6Q69_328 [Firmicutes bacterium]|nr:hypothetical protein [Bacillota bacterium]